MPTEGEQVHIDTDEARAGSTPHITRWVLTFGLLGAIVLLTAIWVIGAWSSDQHNQTADAQIRAALAASGSNTDSIVGKDAGELKNAVTPGESAEPQNMPNKKSGQ